MLSSGVLVLNRSFMPVHITSVKRAFTLLYQGIAKAVDKQYELFDFDSWADLAAAQHDETVGLVGRVIRVPRVILLIEYDRLPRRPEWSPLYGFQGRHRAYEAWRPFLNVVDASYWNVELKD